MFLLFQNFCGPLQSIAIHALHWLLKLRLLKAGIFGKILDPQSFFTWYKVKGRRRLIEWNLATLSQSFPINHARINWLGSYIGLEYWALLSLSYISYRIQLGEYLPRKRIKPCDTPLLRIFYATLKRHNSIMGMPRTWTFSEDLESLLLRNLRKDKLQWLWGRV
jgi:hypothetical protein